MVFINRRDHGGFEHKNQKMSDFLGIAQIVEHTDGTSGAERGCNTDWTLVCEDTEIPFEILLLLNSSTLVFLQGKSI